MTTLESSLAASIEIEPIPPSDLAFSHLDLYPTEMCTQVHQETCIRMFATVLFAASHTVNNSNGRCRIDKLWYIIYKGIMNSPESLQNTATMNESHKYNVQQKEPDNPQNLSDQRLS